MAAGNIPGTSLFKKECPLSAMLICGGDQTPATRHILLLTIASNRIPEQCHRNFGTVTKEVMIDTECFLVWYANLMRRSMGKNIKKVFVKQTPRQTIAGIVIDDTSTDDDNLSHDLDATDIGSENEKEQNEQNDDLDQLISMVHLANDQDNEEEGAVHQTISF